MGGGEAANVFDSLFVDKIFTFPLKKIHEGKNAMVDKKYDKLHGQILSAVLSENEVFIKNSFCMDTTEFCIRICGAHNKLYIFLYRCNAEECLGMICVKRSQLTDILDRHDNFYEMTEEEIFETVANLVEVRTKYNDGISCIDMCLLAQRKLILYHTQYVCGYLSNVSVFGRRVGEMNMSLYLPRFGQTLHIDLDLQILKHILENANSNLERNTLQSSDMTGITKLILHRLVISPTFLSYEDMDIFSPEGGARFDSVQKKSFPSNINLKIRTKGDPGTILCKFLYKIDGAVFVITLKEVGISNDFKIEAYETKGSHVFKISISSLELSLFFKCKRRHYLQNVLKKRLKIKKTNPLKHVPPISGEKRLVYPTKFHHLYFDRILLQTTKIVGKVLFSVKAYIEIKLTLKMFVILVTSLENGDIYRYKVSDCLIRNNFPDTNPESNSSSSFDDIEGIFKIILVNICYDNEKDNIFLITANGNLYGEKIERYNSTFLDAARTREREENLKQRSFNNSAERGNKCEITDRKGVIVNPNLGYFGEYSNNFLLDKKELAVFETFENNQNRNVVVLFHDSLKV